MKFYLCSVCKTLIEVVNIHGTNLTCCGTKMDHLEPNTEEAAVEKHIPVATVQGDVLEVVVGDVLHPSIEKHYIGFITVKAGDLVLRQTIPSLTEPKATFLLGDYKGEVEVYAWCNLHGLWKTTATV